jgi:hemerythrin-like metal-binding protein
MKLDCCLLFFELESAEPKSMKNELKWSPQLDVCDEKMNDEHKVLIAQMSRLQDLASTKASQQQLGHELVRLLTLTKAHFDHEERFLRSIEYPGFDTHKLIHTQLLKRLDQFVAQFDAGTASMDEKFFGFLRVWLTGHIMDIDHKYGEHILSRKRVS